MAQKEKRLYSAVSQPSNTHASTGLKRSQQDNYFLEHLSNFDNKVQQDLIDNFSKGSLALHQDVKNTKTRPKTAKVAKLISDKQNLQHQIRKNNHKLMRLESANHAIKQNQSLSKNESLAPSSSNYLLNS